MDTSTTAAFWADDDYDRELSSDGVSRYGHYVRSAAATPNALIGACFDDGYWDDEATRTAHFAAAAWETATGPVMSPGYIREHPRVLDARVQVSGWDGTLTGTVALAAPWPAPLAGARDWQAGAWWHDWEQQSLIGSPGYFRGPDEQDEARYPYLLTTARLIFPLGPAVHAALPPAPRSADSSLVPAAKAAVAALARAMNTVVVPVIGAIETGRFR